MIAKALEKIGLGLFYLGAACFAGTFLIVLLNGTWPEFLGPVRTLFGFVSNLVGSWAFIIELWIFIGPGLALFWLGKHFQGES